MSIDGLSALMMLDLINYKQLKKLPEGIYYYTGLVTLSLDGYSSLEELPSSIKGLRALATFNLINCERLKKLPKEIYYVYKFEDIESGWLFKLRRAAKLN